MTFPVLLPPRKNSRTLQRTINRLLQSRTQWSDSPQLKALAKFSFSLLAPRNPGHPCRNPPHVGSLPADSTWQDNNNDLLNPPRGSLPITMFISSTGTNRPSTHFPSFDVNLLRFIHHPFARVAEQEHDAIFLRTPISPARSDQSMARPPSDLIGPNICATSYGSSASYGPYPRPSLAHRASDTYVFTHSRYSLVPEIRQPFPSSHVPRRLSDNCFAISSRALPLPIPGPLPKA
ncbi:hypothetical protein BDR03DRAFT_164108 [Suillus americanus]|nr:hypothetical protein BDR03DRAFT_164108 [Suillus americanus]